jgi:nondiscriminating aspartyl-tRNA synthetase
MLPDRQAPFCHYFWYQSKPISFIVDRNLQAENYQDYLQCFKYGMPPHGGFAIGLERLTAQLAGLSNVKLASLFPRDINRLSP